jgi:molybdopterin synthase catalytic subunit
VLRLRTVGPYDDGVRPPATGDDWIALTGEPLPVGAAYEWAVVPGCGGTVVFSGTVRDHADGRSGVTQLSYEAYAEQAEARLAALAADARRRWPDLGRVVLLHRLGDLALCESSVVVVASAPHRGEAFDAARHLIDTLKETVPIWKKETWEDGTDWADAAHEVREIEDRVEQ